jgi:mercuric ion binding protein
MKPLASTLLALALLTSPLAARAAQRTVVLDVHHANCPSCPLIVKSALAHAKGVKAVKVSPYTGKDTITATVTYDDALTSPPALIKVTTDHGYPSSVADAARSAGKLER